MKFKWLIIQLQNKYKIYKISESCFSYITISILTYAGFGTSIV